MSPNGEHRYISGLKLIYLKPHNGISVEPRDSSSEVMDLTDDRDFILMRWLYDGYNWAGSSCDPHDIIILYFS